MSLPPPPTPIPRVSYISSPSLLLAADSLPSNPGRATLVHSLIVALGLLQPTEDDEGEGEGEEVVYRGNRARLVRSEKCTREDLTAYHDEEFVDYLLGRVSSDSDSEGDEEEEERSVTRTFGTRTSSPPLERQKTSSFGLVDDCPMFEGLGDYVLEVGGASLVAARELRDGRADIAIAWTGGRHHAKRGEASGFCYINDIVLSVLTLRSPSPIRPRPPPLSRILYIDLDLHHGDGVESAFHSTSSVLTLSLHLHSPLFFPSTGSLSSTGPSPPSKAAYHALNIALEPGLSPPTLLRLFSLLARLQSTFSPSAVVLQCGTDGLAGDPCAEWNLNLEVMGEIVRRVCAWGVKTLLLGGGGYEEGNTARAWAYFTSIALGNPLDLSTCIPADLPERMYEKFKPGFTLDVREGNRRDMNTEESLARVESAFEGYLGALEGVYGK